MKIKEFVKKVCEKEKGKREVDVAQLSEMLKVINNLTYGLFYFLVKLLPK